MSSLHKAVSHEARECVDCLMSPGDEMNVMQEAIERFGIPGRIRCYSLEKACSPGRPEIAKRLVESGAHLADAGPMKCAAEKEHPKVAAQPA